MVNGQPIIVGRFTGRKCKDNNKWYTKSPKLLFNFYSTHIIHKYGRGPRSGNLWAKGKASYTNPLKT